MFEIWMCHCIFICSETVQIKYKRKEHNDIIVIWNKILGIFYSLLQSEKVFIRDFAPRNNKQGTTNLKVETRSVANAQGI